MPCTLIVYSSRFWKHNHNWISSIVDSHASAMMKSHHSGSCTNVIVYVGYWVYTVVLFQMWYACIFPNTKIDMSHVRFILSQNAQWSDYFVHIFLMCWDLCRIKAQWGYASLQHVSFRMHTHIWPYALKLGYHMFAGIFSGLHYHSVIFPHLLNNTITKHLAWWATSDEWIRCISTITLPLSPSCHFFLNTF